MDAPSIVGIDNGLPLPLAPTPQWYHDNFDINGEERLLYGLSLVDISPLDDLVRQHIVAHPPPPVGLDVVSVRKRNQYVKEHSSILLPASRNPKVPLFWLQPALHFLLRYVDHDSVDASMSSSSKPPASVSSFYPRSPIAFTIRNITAYVLRLGEVGYRGRVNLYAAFVPSNLKEQLALDNTTGADIDYEGWYKKYPIAAGGLEDNVDELVYYSRDHQCVERVKSRDDFINAIAEALNHRIPFMPFLVRPKGSNNKEGESQLRADIFQHSPNPVESRQVFVSPHIRNVKQAASTPRQKPAAMMTLSTTPTPGGVAVTPSPSSHSNRMVSESPSPSNPSPASYPKRARHSSIALNSNDGSPMPPLSRRRIKEVIVVSSSSSEDDSSPRPPRRMKKVIVVSSSSSSDDDSPRPPRRRLKSVASLKLCSDLAKGKNDQTDSTTEDEFKELLDGEEEHIKDVEPADPSAASLTEGQHAMLSDLEGSLKCSHMDLGLFHETCELFGHDPNVNHVSSPFHLGGLKIPALPHQAMGAVWALKTAEVMRGVFICDDTGLGKTLILFLIFVIHAHISTTRAAVMAFWNGDDIRGDHLPQSHVSVPGAIDKCPSQRLNTVPCWCLPNSITRKLRHRFGPTLAFVLSVVSLSQFRSQWERHIDADASCFNYSLELLIGHGDTSFKDNRISDRVVKYFAPPGKPASARDVQYENHRTCHFLVLTTSKSYETHVAKRLQFTSVLVKSKRTDKYRVDPGVRWACIERDENHADYGVGTKGVIALTALASWGSPMLACFSATPWETKLEQVFNYYWTWANTAWSDGSDEKHPHHGFTKESLGKLCKTYSRLTSRRAGTPTLKQQKEISDLIDTLGKFMSALAIIRVAGGPWLFHGETLSLKPPHIHKPIFLKMDAETQDSLNKENASTAKLLRSKKAGGINLETKARLARFFATFPRARSIQRESNLMFTLKEMVENNWHSSPADGSPYSGPLLQQLVADSPKLHWIVNKFIPLVRKRRDSRGQPAKGLIFAHSPAAIAAIHGHLESINVHHYYMSSFMSEAERAGMINDFNSDNPDRHNRFPLFMLGTVKVLGTGSDIFRANYVVLVEVCFTVGDETQAKGRVNRLSTRGTSYSFSLLIEGDSVEMAIRERQAARTSIQDATLRVTAGHDGSESTVSDWEDAQENLGEFEA